MKVLITGGSGFIGTNAVERFVLDGHEVLNYSNTEPYDPKHVSHWRRGDILDRASIEQAFKELQPDWVLHLAARAECDEETTVEEGYRANTEGTQNILEAIRQTPSVTRAIIVSSQFVCGPGHVPTHDEDFAPVTVYGQSKVITEQLTRAADLPCVWTLVRPTNIWGPWHMRYTREFWRVVRKGLYVHPGGKPVVRAYGYVGNVIHQMQRILELPAEKVRGKVFYLGDPPGDILRWVDAFSRQLRGSPARTIPRPVLRALGFAGDVISKATGKPFYITTSRYRSMTTDYVVPMEETYAVLGEPPIPLEQGVRETAEWLERWETIRSNPESFGAGRQGT